MATTMNRRGMTLVELLVAMVATTVVMAAVYQILVTNQRVYTVQREQVMGHQTARAGSEVLFSELRQISPAEGDLTSMGQREVSFRSLRAFALVCDLAPSDAHLFVRIMNDDFSSGQGLIVFVENDPETSADDEWAVASIQSVSRDVDRCDGDVGSDALVHRLTSSGLASGDYSGIQTGAPVRTFESYTYGSFQVDGDWYLARRTGSDTPVPLVGPIEGREGVRFEYLRGDGTTATTASEVRRVRVTLRTRSEARDNRGNQVADSVTTDVFLRN